MLLAAQLADQLGRAFPIGALTTTVGCRIGDTCRRDGDDAAALLRHASEALAEAKASDGATIRDACGDGEPAAPIEESGSAHVRPQDTKTQLVGRIMPAKK